MDLNIKKDKRNKGKYFCKSNGFGCAKTKELALKDISDCCGENLFYSRNYVRLEAIVLKACSLNMQIIKINTCKL